MEPQKLDINHAIAIALSASIEAGTQTKMLATLLSQAVAEIQKLTQELETLKAGK